MLETATPTAPPAPSGQVTIVKGPAPKPLPPPSQTINVSQMRLDSLAPSTPPKPGSAKSRMFGELGRKAGIEPEPVPTPAAKPDTAPVPESSPAAHPAAETTAGGSEPSSSESPPQPTGEAPKGGKEKVQPWKLVETYKKRATELEKELADAKSSILPENDRKALTERLQKAEARAKELDEHIRFVDYSKSKEFVEQYDAPYQQAWQRAMLELQEVPLTDPQSGQSRMISQEDMVELVNLSLPKAKAIARELFGDFADDVMQRRNELRVLLQKKATALEEAKKNGAQREQQMATARQNQEAELANFIKGAWQKVASEVLADEQLGVYFKPREGDDNWNQRLTKGEELVNQVFGEMGRLRDPNIPPNERAQMIKRIVAVRNRAMGWSALKDDRDKLAARVAELEKEIKDRKASVPAVGGSAPTNGTTGAPATGRERLFAELQKRAH